MELSKPLKKRLTATAVGVSVFLLALALHGTGLLEVAELKTHPNFSTRIAAVQKVMQSEGLKPTGVLQGDRFARLGKGV